MRRQFRTFAPEKKIEMVTELVIVWALAVVAFFVLWAILAKVIQRISNRKHKDGSDSHDAEFTENTSERNN